MDASYARDRQRKPHLVFRYRCRALIAAQMYRRFGGLSSPRILDLGSADGLAMAETHALLRASESVGIEFAPDLIAHAQLPPGCGLHQGDVTQPHAAAPDGSFDLVTALAVLEHVDHPDELARRVFAALRPGGVFVATCPYPVWDQISGALRLHKDEHHAGAFNKSRFEAFAAAGGLEPLKYQRFMLAPVGFLPYLRIPLSPALSLAADRILAPIPVVNLAMVNQVFVARRPA
ncbi:Ubiquinone biosynthesis O-methyltransferase [Phycisphaerales bacterium]|nr:Ubiquinone biosynthesis O-methyltransferase [Phycisphaerales bacterium]